MSDTTQDRLAQIAQRVEAATETRARAWAAHIGARIDAEVARTGAHWAGGIADRIRKQERRRSFEAGWDAARTDIPAMHAALTAVLGYADRSATAAYARGDSGERRRWLDLHIVIERALGGE